MNILNLILTTISLILSIVSDIIALKYKKRIDKLDNYSDVELLHTSKKIEYIENRYKFKNKIDFSEKFTKNT